MAVSNATSVAGSGHAASDTQTSQKGNIQRKTEDVVPLEEERVLIAGGGPVGLVLATVLSSYGIKSVILERNATTTKRVSSITLRLCQRADTVKMA